VERASIHGVAAHDEIVIPAQAGTHGHSSKSRWSNVRPKLLGSVIMGSRLRGNDMGLNQGSRPHQ
jgi:hypothetical protein